MYDFLSFENSYSKCVRVCVLIHLSIHQQNVVPQIKEMTNILKVLETDLPDFVRACNDFCQDARKIEQQRLSDRCLLEHHTQIRDLLEVPQWMENTVKNGLYEETLQIQNFSQKLFSRHSDVPLLSSIVSTVLNPFLFYVC